MGRKHYLTPLAAVAGGFLAGSLRRRHAAYGPAVWAAGYVILPEGGLHQPIWEYDAKTLAWDLSGHLAYGAAAGITFGLLAMGLDTPGQSRRPDSPSLPSTEPGGSSNE